MNSKYIYTSYIKKLTPIDEFDTEKFILEVQKRACIWDVNSKSYNLKCVRNRETKKRAWEEIAKIFNTNWDSLTPEERQKKVDALSKKWANIRKYYTDEVRKPANSPPKKRRRRYHHLLAFLDDAVNKKRVSRIKEFKNIGKEKVNVDSSSDSESGELFIVEDAEELRQLSSESANRTVTPAPSDKKFPDVYLDNKREPDKPLNLWENTTAMVKPINEMKATQTEMGKRNPEIMKLLKESRGLPPINNNFLYFPAAKPAEDNILSRALTLDQTAEASKKFLLSLLPEIMSLNVKQNLQFRLGIMDLLNDIKLRVKTDVNAKLYPNINFN